MTESAGSAREAAEAKAQERPRRRYRGPHIFAHGFRPFFFLAGLWAATAVLLWMLAYAGAFPVPSAFDPFAWHAHEMLFGYVAAAVAGFLFTAVPNWTGRLPVHGLPLAGFAALWLAGRILVFVSGETGAVLAAAVDCAFLALLALAVLREIVAGRNWRNLPVAGIVTVFAAANLLTHLEAIGVAATGALGLRLGIGLIAVLIAVIGGRVTPSFTSSWLRRSGVTPPNVAFSNLDRLGLAAVAAGALAWIVAPESWAAAVLLLLAGVMTALRLARWRFDRTLSEPLVWILHLGYAWLAAGFLLLAAAAAFGAPTPAAALHGITAGAMGVMPLAVMTRATLGHTGRPLQANRSTVLIYAAVTAAAVLRIVSPSLGDAATPALHLSAALWIAAFFGFALVYAPMFFGPRADASKA